MKRDEKEQGKIRKGRKGMKKIRERSGREEKG
jgi:hypothetical protein